ncbi:MAG: DUF1987 domain-containing protein [Bacteroidales bacterium]|nr:DUF1987 domain-containing protein [Bacteroidales bacterium]
MRELNIRQGKNSPEIILNPAGFIKIKGRSIHENVVEFLKPVEQWIDEYIENPADLTCVDITLEYFNSASARALIRLLQKITLVQLKHKKFVFNWYYESGDEDILERGEYFENILGVPFNFIRLD